MRAITGVPSSGGKMPMPSGKRGVSGRPVIKVGGVSHKVGTAKPARRGAPTGK